MKFVRAVVLPVLIVLAVSCASRPPAFVDPVDQQKLLIEQVIQEALPEIENNSLRIKKYFEPREAIVSGSGYSSVADITVKGAFEIDGKKYTVIYNFSDAVKDEGDMYQISFCLEDPVNGVSHNDILSWTPAEEEAGLLLSFDDAFFDTWSAAFDLFDSYGAKVTFFVQGDFQPDSVDEAEASSEDGSEDDSPRALVKGAAQFCAEALEKGHCVGFHTVNHFDLRKVTREIFYAETIEAASVFLKNGIRLNALAYPFGFSEQWMRDVLAQAFPVTRGYGTNIRLYHTGIGNSGYIGSTAIDNIIYPDDAKFKNDLLRILLAAKFTGNSVVPFTTHEISDEAQWGITPERLEYLLKITRELKMKFYTYDDFAALFSLKR